MVNNLKINKKILWFAILTSSIFLCSCSHEVYIEEVKPIEKIYIIEKKEVIQEEINKSIILQNSDVNKSAPGFLNEEQKELFNNALYVLENIKFKKYEANETEYKEIDGKLYIKVNNIFECSDYKSFIEMLSNIFTNNWIETNIENKFIEYNNDIYVLKDDISCNQFFYKSHNFSIQNINDTAMSFNCTTEIFENPHSLLTNKEQFTYKIILTKNGWRFENFQLWY